MKWILVLMAIAMSGLANASVPSPFDYARGALEQGIVIDDQAPGSYFYGNEGGPDPQSWNDSRYKVQHEQEEQKDAVDSRREDQVLRMAPADTK